MYDCSTIMKLVHAYLDGQLDVKESLRVESHVQECQDCRENYLAEKEFQSLVHRSATVTPAPGVCARCLQATLSGSASPRASALPPALSPPWVATSLVVASTVAVAFFIFLKVPGEQPPGLVKWAVAEHRQAIQDPSRLQITSSDPQVVSRWLYEQRFDVAFTTLEDGPHQTVRSQSGFQRKRSRRVRRLPNRQ
jgi:anti-sigma factor RsiW